MKETAFVEENLTASRRRCSRRCRGCHTASSPFRTSWLPRPQLRYELGAGDGTRAGCYRINLYDLKSRLLYEIEALSCQ
jgi:hypothetical protein